MTQSESDPQADITAEIERLLAWTGDLAGIQRVVECRTFPAAISLVDRVAEQAEAMDHHPDIDIRWRTVTFTLSTHTKGRVTTLDIALAQAIDRLVETS